MPTTRKESERELMRRDALKREWRELHKIRKLLEEIGEPPWAMVGNLTEAECEAHLAEAKRASASLAQLADRLSYKLDKLRGEKGE